jgi:hypothetical protein
LSEGIEGRGDALSPGTGIGRELNKSDDVAIALEGIGECHLRDGDLHAGAARLREAFVIYERLGMKSDISRIQARLRAIGASQL